MAKVARIALIVLVTLVSLLANLPSFTWASAGECGDYRAVGPAILEFGDYNTGKPVVLKLNSGHTSLRYGGGCSPFISQEELNARWAFHVQEFLVDRLDGEYRISSDFRNKPGVCNDADAIGPALLEYVENGKAVTVKLDALQRASRFGGACFPDQSQEELDFSWPTHIRYFVGRYPGAIVRVVGLPRQFLPLVQVPQGGPVCAKGDWSVGPAILEGPIGGRPTAVKLNMGSRFFLADGYCRTFSTQQELEQFWPAHLEAFLAKYPNDGRPLER